MLGAALGIGGLVLVFLPELARGAGKGDAMLGIAFALGGAVTASLGNIVASRNHGRGLPVVQMNTFGMLYGALFVALFALVTRQPFVFDWSPRYLLSLAYLTVFGSILAFGAFLVLLGRIGADRAGYITVAGAGNPALCGRKRRGALGKESLKDSRLSPRGDGRRIDSRQSPQFQASDKCSDHRA